MDQQSSAEHFEHSKKSLDNSGISSGSVPEETGARSWDAQSRNGKEVLCDEVKPDAGEVKKATEKEQEEKNEIETVTLTPHSPNPLTWSPAMTTPSLRTRDARLQTPPGEASPPSVPKTTKNDKVTKMTFKKKAATSIKQLKAKVVKEESEEEGDDIQEGVIYVFCRTRVGVEEPHDETPRDEKGQVGVEEPQGIGDVARSYIILRPLPLGGKLDEGLRENPADAKLLTPVL
ncbi:hypothetical protein BGZ57DRAFT_926925 [Hyaloscypha finlandica]|nr:hypothetical protein BGZ57DRAFT_926925 [Hyaloscypha finlandica]